MKNNEKSCQRCKKNGVSVVRYKLINGVNLDNDENVEEKEEKWCSYNISWGYSPLSLNDNNFTLSLAISLEKTFWIYWAGKNVY